MELAPYYSLVFAATHNGFERVVERPPHGWLIGHNRRALPKLLFRHSCTSAVGTYEQAFWHVLDARL